MERSGTADPVVLLHGFTQNARRLGTIQGVALSDATLSMQWTFRVTVARARIRADLWGTGGTRLRSAVGPADFVGYSLGGRVLLHLALARPDVVRRAVFIGATAGIEDVDGTCREGRRR